MKLVLLIAALASCGWQDWDPPEPDRTEDCVEPSVDICVGHQPGDIVTTMGKDGVPCLWECQ